MQTTIRSTLFALSLLALSAAARGETTDCTVMAALPFTITQSGVYCLKASQQVNGVGVFVVADDVTIDLNAHAIVSAGINGIAIINQQTQKNIVVRNGTIRGFAEGVNLTGPGHLVERMRVEGSADAGIAVNGPGATVRNNVVTGVGSPSCCSTGIFVFGYGARILDNEILETGLTSKGEANAIKIGEANGALVAGNIIANSLPDPNGGYPAGIQVGPINNSSMKVRVFGNHITNMGMGVFVTTTSQSVLLKDNVVSGTVTPFSGGVQVGTTNIVF
jgi:hypothetical protein